MIVNLIYLTNLNYRKSLFEEISKHCEFNLIAGNKSPYSNIVVDESETKYNFYTIRNFFFLNGHHRLTFQMLSRKVLKLIRKPKESEFVFLGIDVHIFSSLLYALILIFLGYKVSWWGHGTLGKGLTKKIRVFIYKKSYRIIVYGNNSEVSRLISLKGKVRVIGNTMNWSDYSDNLLKKEKLICYKTNTELRMLFSGRIIKSKKLEILLNACKVLNINYHLKIIGDGDEVSLYKKYCLENSLNVTFLGAIYGEGVKNYMNWSDIMVIPGKVGLSLVHAYSNRLPVIIHDTFEEHSPEFEIHTMNKEFLFKKDSINDLSNKLEIIHTKKLLPKETAHSSDMLYKYGYFPDIVASKFIESFN